MSDCLKAFWSFVYNVRDLWMETGRRERHVTLAPTTEANALFTSPCQSGASDNFTIHYPIFNHERRAKSKCGTVCCTLSAPIFLWTGGIDRYCKGYFTSLKNPFRKHSTRTNLFLLTVSDKNKSVEKSEVWTMKCEGTVAQSGRESWVQMESNQLKLVAPIYYKSVFLRCNVPQSNFQTFGNNLQILLRNI